jgi:lipopolysaccharide/colanic/teichoic acid biosynthesis glycosyltransferase
MTNSTAGAGALLTASGDSRVTPFGRWLRSTKCDELPQLFNVITGDMSLVGPRPEVPRYTEKYSAHQLEVLGVRPGITGPTANEYISEEELLATAPDKEEFYLSVLLPAKLESDLRYTRNISFNTDLKLIANTVMRLLLKSQNNRKLMSNAPQREL